MKLSKEVNQWIWYIVIFVIIVAFVGFYGFDRSGSGGSFVVAKVNGKPIHLDNYKVVLEQNQKEYKLNEYDGAEREQVSRMVEQRSLGELVQKELILQTAKVNGIRISPSEILQVVAMDKRFQDDNGRFQPQIWKRAPNYFKKRLEKDISESLQTQYLVSHLYNAVRVSDAEIRQQFQMKNTKVKVAYVFDSDKSQSGLDNNMLMPLANEGNKIDQMTTLLNQGVSFQAAAAQLGLPVRTTDYFSFAGRIRLQGSTNETAQPLEAVIDTYRSAFAMKPGSVSPAINTRGGKVILLVLGRQEADWNDLGKQVSQLQQEVLSATQRDYVNQWMNSLYSSAKIEDKGFRRLHGLDK
jgi:hypothetical protein